jgi:hypothetical protein
MSKTQLPYLIREALEAGEWKLNEIRPNTEKYTRGEDSILIGTRALRGTNPPSYVYELNGKQSMTVINSLCAMLAKK